MSARVEAAASCAGAYANSWAELWHLVSLHGVEEAAAASWFPGCGKTIDEIAAQIRQLQQARREPAA